MRSKKKKTGLDNTWIKSLLIGIGIVVLGFIIYFTIHGGQAYFRRRNIRLMATTVNGYGVLAPVAIFILIFISTLIPPLPVPIPLLEIAAGYIFGLWEGIGVVWISEILSSLGAFYLTRLFGRRFILPIVKSRLVSPYWEYIERRGPMAIIATRAFMAAPMNIVSFLAGLTPMETSTFVWSTALGTIPEAVLYATAGMILKTTRFSLGKLFLIIVIVGTIGPVCMAFMYRFMKPRKKNTSSIRSRRV